MTMSADAAVIESSISDSAAFATIFDRHARSIHRFLARRIDPAEADGLVGEVSVGWREWWFSSRVQLPKK